MNNKYITTKTLIIGDVAIGKSSLMLRFVNDIFDDSYNVTVGVECLVKKVETESGATVAVQLWDTAGHERFRSIVKSFFKDCNAVLICFSFNKKESLNSIKEWHKLAQESCNTDPFYILCGTQSDLEHKVTMEEAQAAAKEIGAKACLATSAKSNDGVSELFQQVADFAVGDRHNVKNNAMRAKKEDSIKLGVDLRLPRERKKKKEKCNC